LDEHKTKHNEKGAGLKNGPAPFSIRQFSANKRTPTNVSCPSQNKKPHENYVPYGL
jgi:hypothetical protein